MGLFLSACVPFSPAPVAAKESPDLFKVWVDARAGTDTPVHWIAEGGVYAYPSGEKLFGMVGFDSSMVQWPKKPGDPVLHFTRKTFAYTDPVTGEILTEYQGKPVQPIAYPYQLITYRYEDGKIYGDVEQGTAPNVQKIRSEDGMTVRMMGENTVAITAAVFLDFPLPDGQQYEAWENYDFFIHLSGDISEPHQMSWQRYGGLPSWAGDGKAIYHLLSWRVDSHDEFPPYLLEWAQSEMPRWLSPPEGLKEIRTLQNEPAGQGWAK